MAIGIENLTNIDTSNPSLFPNGCIKDDTGTGNGTPANKLAVNDIYFFFDKLMRLAGITASNSFDTESSSQYITALTSFLKSPLSYFTTAASVPITSVSGGQNLAINDRYVYEFNVASGSFPGTNIITFGDAAPGTKAYFFFTTGSTIPTITLNSTSAGTHPMIVQNGFASANTAWTPVTNKTFMVIRRTNVWEIVA